MKIKWHLTVGLVGCDRHGEVEVEDDADDAEIQAAVDEAISNVVSWYWTRPDEE